MYWIKVVKMFAPEDIWGFYKDKVGYLGFKTHLSDWHFIFITWTENDQGETEVELRDGSQRACVERMCENWSMPGHPWKYYQLWTMSIKIRKPSLALNLSKWMLVFLHLDRHLSCYRPASGRRRDRGHHHRNHQRLYQNSQIMSKKYMSKYNKDT